MYDGRVGGGGSPGQIPPPGGFGIVKPPTHVKLERFRLSLHSLGTWGYSPSVFARGPKVLQLQGEF